MLWLNFLHLYQPANSEKSAILQAVDSSYERLLRALEEHPNLKFTANITGGLLERLATDLNLQQFLERLKAVIKSGQLELVGSAAYHALLPLVTEREVYSQIREQEILLKKYLGVERMKGFFLPEMAYSPQVAKIIKSCGYEWIIVDEIAVSGRLGSLGTPVLIDSNSGLRAVVRDRTISESYVPETLLEFAKSDIDRTIVTATDAELYGLRHIDQTAVFELAIRNKKIRTETISKFIAKNSVFKKVKLKSSNWNSEEIDLLNDKPFALWDDKNNLVQNKLWILAALSQELYYRHIDDINAWWSRWHLWRGLQSCAWWWASRHDFRGVFGPLAWSPDEIERGVNELIRSIRSLESSTDKKIKIKAEKLAQAIRTEIWLNHWQ